MAACWAGRGTLQLKNGTAGTLVVRRWLGLVTKNWERKRFYKEASVCSTDGGYGVMLDHRRLRTPHKKVFVVPTEPLALGVAEEWSQQSTVIQPSLMHLTALCNTVLDNPLKLTNLDIINQVLIYLATDTIRHRVDEPDELVTMQQQEWDPILNWFNDRYNGDLQAGSSLLLPDPTPSLIDALTRSLMKMDLWALAGFQLAVESCKSFILSSAAREGRLDTRDACRLALLEVRHQTSQWGSVEWQHEIDAQDLTSRLAAGILMSQLSETNEL